MRWSFWLFVLAEFCRRCETKGTWRGVFSGVPSGIQEQSSWGGQGKPHEAVGFLALGWNWFHWLSENVTRCATRTSVFAGTTLRGDTPIFSHRFCANLMSGPGGQWGGFKPPLGGFKPPVASPLDMSLCTSLRNFMQIGPPSAEKEWRHVDFQDGGSQPSWILVVQ